MSYENFATFKATQSEGILTVTFDFPPVNVQGQEMLADLNSLALRLERDRNIKVVVFDSAHPEIWVDSDHEGPRNRRYCGRGRNWRHHHGRCPLYKVT